MGGLTASNSNGDVPKPEKQHLKETLNSLFKKKKLRSKTSSKSDSQSPSSSSPSGSEHASPSATLKTEEREEFSSAYNAIGSFESNAPEETAKVTEAKKPNGSPFVHRALPPVPRNEEGLEDNANSSRILDYAASIEKVKECGWYWGPVSGDVAEKLLSSEPDGSFIVRDSSDEHYIFSLTFKLDGLVRHVRIEHDQGNFSFGCLQKFQSNTIVDFIEDAVQHSRSGRYLFFLHRRAAIGPMRVQLLHPVSRFKTVQSLQHLCRFVLLKHVRKDLIKELPLPDRLQSYLSTPYYYTEDIVGPQINSSLVASALS